MIQRSHHLQRTLLNLVIIFLGLFFIVGSEGGDSPIITILGENPVTVRLGDLYVDAGATAEDTEDGAVKVVTTGLDTLDTSVAKTYTVTYTATDQDDNKTVAIRSVIVKGMEGVLTGRFIDSAVGGLEYTTDTIRSLTNDDGYFQYREGEIVHFKIGGVDLGSAVGDDIITPLMLSITRSITDVGVTNRVRFIVSLDEDNNPDNGITISSQTRQRLANKSLDFSLSKAEFEPLAKNLIKEARGNTVNMITAETAQTHLAKSLADVGLPTDCGVPVPLYGSDHENAFLVGTAGCEERKRLQTFLKLIAPIHRTEQDFLSKHIDSIFDETQHARKILKNRARELNYMYLPILELAKYDPTSIWWDIVKKSGETALVSEILNFSQQHTDVITGNSKYSKELSTLLHGGIEITSGVLAVKSGPFSSVSYIAEKLNDMALMLGAIYFTNDALKDKYNLLIADEILTAYYRNGANWDNNLASTFDLDNPDLLGIMESARKKYKIIAKDDYNPVDVFKIVKSSIRMIESTLGNHFSLPDFCKKMYPEFCPKINTSDLPSGLSGQNHLIKYTDLEASGGVKLNLKQVLTSVTNKHLYSWRRLRLSSDCQFLDNAHFPIYPYSPRTVFVTFNPLPKVAKTCTVSMPVKLTDAAGQISQKTLKFKILASDSDKDGMPDQWEIDNGFDPKNPSDANGNPDHDHLTNKEEYEAGTDPHSAEILLSVNNRTQNAVISWTAMGGNNIYTVYMAKEPFTYQDILDDKFKNKKNAVAFDAGTQPSAQVTPTAEELAQGVDVYLLLKVKNNETNKTRSISQIMVINFEKEALPAPHLSGDTRDSEIYYSFYSNHFSASDKYTLYVAEESGITPQNYSIYKGGRVFDNITSPFSLPTPVNGKTYFAVVTATKDSQESLPSSETQNTAATLISINNKGERAKGGSPSISANGRYIAFSSEDSKLNAGGKYEGCGGSAACRDIFVHDRQLKLTTKVSVDSNGIDGDKQSASPKISGNGRYVVFISIANNLVENIPDVGNGRGGRVYLHDRQTKKTTLVSKKNDGTPYYGSEPDIDESGRYIAFSSLGLLDNSCYKKGEGGNIVLYDRETNKTTLVSSDLNGNNICYGASGQPRISADGRYIAFTSTSNKLVNNDENNTSDIFVYDREEGVTSLASKHSNGIHGNSSSFFTSEINSNGRYITFASAASNLVDQDTNGNELDIFVHNLKTKETKLVSVDEKGQQFTYSASLSGVSINSDGDFITYSGEKCMYLYNQNTEKSVCINVDTRPYTGNGHSMDISADGSSMAFVRFGSAAGIFVLDLNEIVKSIE